MIVLLSGQIKNIGDFLITERARQLLEAYLDKDIVILDRSKNLEEHLEIINKSRYLILGGGPAYAKNIYKGIYPLVDDLSKIKVPIVPFGLGWSGTPAGEPKKFSFCENSQQFLEQVHKSIPNSSCRDIITQEVLNNNGFTNVVMTGCPVWYDLSSIGKDFKTYSNLKKIVFSTAANPKLISQTINILKVLVRQFPNSEITLAYHRGIMPDKHTTIRATIGYLTKALGAKLVYNKVKIKDVSYNLDKIKFYDDCDFHIGYRVHAHLYFLSKRLPSVLINEDGRGQGMVKSMNLPVFNVEDRNLVESIETQLKNYKASHFREFKEVKSYIDKQFKLMKDFLEDLN